MKVFPRWAGRLMRGAICGLLATAALPAVASADLSGGVSVSTPIVSTSINVSVPTPAVPSVNAPIADVSSATHSVVMKTRDVTARTAVTAASITDSNRSRSTTRMHHRARRGLTHTERSLQMSETAVLPLPFDQVNPCVVPSEDVFINGTEHLLIDSQPNGGFAVSTSIQGSAFSLAASYSFSQEVHTWFFGPDATTLTAYDYEKLSRAGDTGSPLNGDDFFLRVFFQIPVGPGGPNVNSLNSAIDGTCR